jgi:vitamin B12 transporter
MFKKKRLKQRAVQFRQWSNKRYAAFNSLKRVVKICTLALAYSIVSKPLAVSAQSADTTGTRIIELDEVTVQSTLIELKNAETGRSIEVIKGSQLQSLPVNSVDELLRYVPGIEGNSRNAFGTQTDFSIRGSNFNQVLVLIDGVKINDPLTAHFNSNIPLSPSEIYKIEIIRGPAAAEYGPDATGGVINIITKTFSPVKPSSKYEVDAKLFYGEQNVMNTQVGFSYNTEKFRLGGGFLTNKSDGQLLKTGLRSDFDINTYSFSGQVQITPKWSAAIRTSRDYRDFNAQRFYTALASDSAHETVTRNRQQLQIFRKTENSSTTIHAGYVNTKDNYLLRPSVKASENYTKLINLQINHNYIIKPGFVLLVGAMADQRSIESNNRGNHSLNHEGLLTGLSFQPLTSLTINTSIRGDYDESYGFNILPQAGISYKIINTLVLRASAGRSIRSADFTENYYNSLVVSPLAANSRLGNPYLEAEKAWSTDAGFDYNFLPGFLFSTTGFYRYSNNLIDYVKTQSSSIKNNSNLLDTSYMYATNISKLKTMGVETRLGIRKSITSKLNVEFIAGYTFLHSENEDSVVSLYISSHAKHLLSSELIVTYGPLSFAINGLYKQRNTQFSERLNVSLSKDYTVWNASMDLAIYKKIVLLSVMTTNIFDSKYSDVLGAEMPGRWIMGGVKIKL